MCSGVSVCSGISRNPISLPAPGIKPGTSSTEDSVLTTELPCFIISTEDFEIPENQSLVKANTCYLNVLVSDKNKCVVSN